MLLSARLATVLQRGDDVELSYSGLVKPSDISTHSLLFVHLYLTVVLFARFCDLKEHQAFFAVIAPLSSPPSYTSPLLLFLISSIYVDRGASYRRGALLTAPITSGTFLHDPALSQIFMSKSITCGD